MFEEKNQLNTPQGKPSKTKPVLGKWLWFFVFCSYKSTCVVWVWVHQDSFPTGTVQVSCLVSPYGAHCDILNRLRVLLEASLLVAGPPGLEPGTAVLETAVLPLNYGPSECTIAEKNATLNGVTHTSSGSGLFLHLFIHYMFFKCRIVFFEL